MRRLHQSRAAGGQVALEAHVAQGQVGEVDHVQVGAHPRRDQAPVGESEQLGVAARLAVDHVGERQGRAPAAVPGPIGELVGRVHRIEDSSDMGAPVGEADHRGVIQLQLAQAVQGVGRIAGEEGDGEVAAVALNQVVIEGGAAARKAAGLGERLEAFLRQRFVAGTGRQREGLVHREVDVGDQRLHRAWMLRRHVDLGQDARLHRRIAQGLGPLRQGQVGEGEIRGLGHERMVGAEAEDEAGRAAADLGEDPGAVAGAFLDHGEDAVRLRRIREGLEQGEGGRAAGRGAEATDHLHLGFQSGMFAHRAQRAGGDQLHHAGAGAAERPGDGHQLRLGGEGARHLVAVDRLVAHDARGGKTDRTSAQGLLDNAGHAPDLGFGGVAVTALGPQHVVANSPVGDHRGDVEGVLAARQVVEILRIGLPGAPGHAFVEGRAGDVLDALHQFDQLALTSRRHGSEADAAVAHDDGADAVAGRGVHFLVPGDLAVVVGVNVDPGRGDDGAVRVDDLPGQLGDVVAHGDDHPILHRHVAGERLAAGAVEDRPAANDGVVHREAPWLCAG